MRLADRIAPPRRTAGYRSIASPIAVCVVLAGLVAGAPLVPAAHAAGVADTVTVLPPVKVEGQRETAAPRTSATEVRLNRGTLTRFLPATSGDALLTVPGVELQKLGPWSSRVSFRGMSSERVLVLVDGVRVNTVRGHGAQASLVSMDRLDEVELLAGASSAQYGSDAMGGVINLVTHRPLFSDRARATVTVTSGGSQPGSGWDQSARARFLFPRYGFELNGSSAGLRNLYTPTGSVQNSGYREQDFGARGAARFGVATLDLEHTHHVARDVGLPAFNNDAGSWGNYPIQSRDADRLELRVAGDGWRPEMRLLAADQRFHTDFREVVRDTVFVRQRPTAVITNDAYDRVQSPAWSVQPELRFGGPLELRANVEYRQEQTHGPRETIVTTQNMAGVITAPPYDTTGASIPPARRDVWSSAVFGGHTFRPARLEAGLRWDVMRTRADEVVKTGEVVNGVEVTRAYHRDVTDRHLSGEAGLSRRIGAIEPYARVASGFRGPNLQERYFRNTIHGGMRVYGNPDLVPERSVSYEAGVRLADAWGGRVSTLRVSAYRSDVHDLINLKYDGLNRGLSDFHYVNVDRARLEGVELASQFRFGWLGAGLNLAMPRGRDLETGEKLVDSGVARATLDLSAPVGWLVPNGRFGTRIRWSDGITGDGIKGAQETVDKLIRPAFWTGSLELTSAFSGFLAMVSVRNVGDLDYREPLSFIPEPGRTFAFSLRRDFNMNLATFGKAR